MLTQEDYLIITERRQERDHVKDIATERGAPQDHKPGVEARRRAAAMAPTAWEQAGPV